MFEWANKIASLGVNIISIADTVGLATSHQVYTITKYLIDHLPGNEIGVNLNSTPYNREEKLTSAIQAGCTRFDGALKGIGGCPMADDELVGNMDTEWMIEFLRAWGKQIDLKQDALSRSLSLASAIFQ